MANITYTPCLSNRQTKNVLSLPALKHLKCISLKFLGQLILIFVLRLSKSRMSEMYNLQLENIKGDW